MTNAAAEPGTTTEATHEPSTRELHEELVRFSRSLHLIKQLGVPRFAGAAPLLGRLQASGPLRSRDLAELVCLDPSTVSRQVDQLVKDGLVRRMVDPDDGRATLLALTPSGLNELQAHRARIGSLLEHILEGWTSEQLRDLTASLRHLNDATALKVPRLVERGRHLDLVPPPPASNPDPTNSQEKNS